MPPDDIGQWDVIVSNPPYICRQEAQAMERNVLDYEPHTALFVSDDDPLLFYRSIARYAQKALKPGGKLFFEINPLYCRQLENMLTEMGYFAVTLREDQSGRQRFIKATTHED
jgi:release factor glutamine methyltransferase